MDMATFLDKILIFKLHMTSALFDFAGRACLKSVCFATKSSSQLSHVVALYGLVPCMTWLRFSDNAITTLESKNVAVVPGQHLHQGCKANSMCGADENSVQTPSKISNSDCSNSGTSVFG